MSKLRAVSPITLNFSVLLDWRIWILPAVFSVLLIVVSIENYLLFHTLAELFSIMVCVLMFVIARETSNFSSEPFLMYLATGYIWIAVIDVLHTLVFKGMSIFPIEVANHSTQFWISARYSEALILLTAPFFFKRSFAYVRYFVLFGVLAITFYLLIMYGYFPDSYIEGQGLTPFKIISEYIIIALLLLTLLHFYLKSELLDKTIFPFLIVSIIFTICAELAFTFYVDVYGLSNLAGHIFKIFSFWLIFYSIVRNSLRMPYESLAQHQLHLESTIGERTKELVQAKNKAEIAYKQQVIAQKIAHMGSWEWNINSGELLWSDETYRIFGLLPQQFEPTYDAFIQSVHPDDRIRVKSVVDSAINNPAHEYSIEHRVLRPDGSMRVVSEDGEVLLDSEGLPLRMIGTIHDITEHHEANEAIEAFNQIMLDREGRIIELKEEVNQLAAEKGKEPSYPEVWGTLSDD